MNKTITRKQFFEAFVPLILALHENKTLTLEQLTDSMTDTLTRRKIDLAQSDDEFAFAYEVLHALQKLKKRVS